MHAPYFLGVLMRWAFHIFRAVTSFKMAHPDFVSRENKEVLFLLDLLESYFRIGLL
jgi:hypothetical protein